MAVSHAVAGWCDVSHPRLWMTQQDQAALVARMETDPLLARMHAVVLDEAGRVLTARTTRYEIPDGRRLLQESRLALHNIGHCAWAWRFTGDERYLKRGIREMEAACALKDWNPSHFLDTAEMSVAVGLGYDWLYSGLSREQRDRFAAALIELGLEEARTAYREGAWWTKPKNNWSQVCGAGIALAALAVSEKNEEITNELFQNGLRLVEKCHRFYEPDGLYPEGPGYWHYGTNYHIQLLAALPALGAKIDSHQILKHSGRSMMHLQGPSGMYFNFADAHTRVGPPSHAQCWIAGHFADPAQVSHVRSGLEKALRLGPARVTRLSPLQVLWCPAEIEMENELPCAAFFHGEQSVAVFRTSWNHDAVWLAVKGGTAAASHGHMDVGSFEYESDGVRWIHDLGSDSYSLPSYFGDLRWQYYRLQNRSHNTLEISGKLQNPSAKPAPLTQSNSGPESMSAEFDLSDAYKGSADQLTRRMDFDAREGTVLVTDRIEKPVGAVVWRVITDAKVKIDHEEVVLSKQGQEARLKNETGVGGWTVAAATPDTLSENQNEGFQQLMLTIPAEKMIEVRVRITP